MTETSPDSPADGLSSAHGATPARGIGNVPRSSIDTGRFGRLFRGLPPLILTDEQVDGLVGQMVDPGDLGGGSWTGTPTPGDGVLAAGWTYFAQFVDHDLTFDPVSMLDQANDPDALDNFRTPRFDLDSVYGLGPVANPWLYQKDDNAKLVVGGDDTGQFLARDVSRNREGVALIGDPRNDVHVIIAQLHLAFVLFHNQVVDRVRTDPSLVNGVPATPVGGWGGGVAPSAEPTFNQIVTLVRWHYQWLVLRDFLPRVVGSHISDLVLQLSDDGAAVTKRLFRAREHAYMPVEFAAAAYRFGHSLVRDSYVLNEPLGPRPIFAPGGETDPLADLRGFNPIPLGWEVEWHRFFDVDEARVSETQRARRFDTQIAPPLHQLPSEIDAQGRSLAKLNLKRGVALELPSGEDVAVAVAGKLRVPPDSLRLDMTLSHPTPLWFWLLREANERANGETLGPVGGRIVAEVLVGLAELDRSSFLSAAPGWRPSLGAIDGQFTIKEFLEIAAVTI